MKVKKQKTPLSLPVKKIAGLAQVEVTCVPIWGELLVFLSGSYLVVFLPGSYD